MSQHKIPANYGTLHVSQRGLTEFARGVRSKCVSIARGSEVLELVADSALGVKVPRHFRRNLILVARALVEELEERYGEQGGAAPEAGGSGARRRPRRVR
jgi:hypothetical protein